MPFNLFIQQLPNARKAWLALSISATLSGNLTLPGAGANAIVAARAKEAQQITFWEYTRAGLPITLLSVAADVLWREFLRP